MDKYTVISIDEDGFQVLADHVEATNYLEAFAVAASIRPYATFITALPGHLTEGKDMFFTGDTATHAETILQQPEVFGSEAGAAH